MAYLKRTRIREATYFYIVRSVRHSGNVRQKTLEYLGRDPDPKRLKAALKYWKVKSQAEGRRAR